MAVSLVKRIFLTTVLFCIIHRTYPQVLPQVLTVDRQWPLPSWDNVTQTEPIEIQSDVPVVLRVHGSGFKSDTRLAFTTVVAERGSVCNDSGLLKPIFRLSTADTLTRESFDIKVNLRAPVKGRGLQTLYVCLGPSKSENGQWVHQGDKVQIKVTSSKVTSTTIMKNSLNRISIHGLRGEGDRAYLSSDGVTNIPADQPSSIRLTGNNFVSKMLIAMTTRRRTRGCYCDDLPLSSVYVMKASDILTPNVAVIDVELSELANDQVYYICTKESDWDEQLESRWVHQGDHPWVLIRAEGRLIPAWLQIWLIIFLQIMSGLFSGLNLGLMALDNTELKIIAKCGTPQEKDYAKTITPLRKRGNYLLCSIVLGNVLVNSILTVLLDDLTSGLVAIIGSTVGIVIFGEIIPQAICSRHALAVGARTAWVTKLFMLFTFPISFPISMILDFVLGDEIANVYDRERLMEYIQVTKEYNKLEKEEMKMISGALELKSKMAKDIMTKIEDVFMMSLDTILNFENITELVGKGYTRVPVYDGSRDNIVALLHTKDLALVDPDDNTPLKTVCQFYNHPIIFVFADETLDTLLNEFKKGRSHMACVRQLEEKIEGDPNYQMLGVVTLEDVIEEIIQAEIMDETDVLTDNRRKQRRKGVQLLHDYSDFVKIGGGGQAKSIVSPQLALAAYQFLSSCVEPFKKPLISESVLRRLLSQNLFFMLKYRHHDYAATSGCNSGIATPVVTIYKSGKNADYFVLVLEGKVKVTVGREKLIYEAGPFSYFGVQAIASSNLPMEPISQGEARGTPNQTFHQLDGLLQSGSYVPDFTVVAVADLVYMKIPRSIYGTALKATLMERQHRHDSSIEDCLGSLGGVPAGGKPRTSSLNEQQFLKSPTSPGENGLSLGNALTNSSLDVSDVCTSEYIITSGTASLSRID